MFLINEIRISFDRCGLTDNVLYQIQIYCEIFNLKKPSPHFLREINIT